MVGWRLASTLVVEVRRALAAGEPFIYAYYDGIDRIAHEFGLDEHYEAELMAADRLVTDLITVLPPGAALVVTGERYNDALLASQEWAAESGAMPVHAYDQVETLLGQGSVGLEFEEQAPHLDTLLVACGGGGLIGGMAAWYEGRTRIVGVEPTGAPTLWSG